MPPPGKDINFKEMHIVLQAMQCWLLHFKVHKLVIFTDNTMVYHGLRRRSVWGPAMDPLRKITLFAALHNIDLHVQWIPTHENALADLLSRRDFTKLTNLFPLLAQEPLLGTRRIPGTWTLAFLASQPAISGRASAQIPDEHTTLPIATTQPANTGGHTRTLLWPLLLPGCSHMGETSGHPRQKHSATRALTVQHLQTLYRSPPRTHLQCVPPPPNLSRAPPGPAHSVTPHRTPGNPRWQHPKAASAARS